ncbi:MAG: DsbA family protein [Cyclobacteriaceae bacterium]|nr:DsbA family protein [Cyclobacteriaceae bacterium]
MKSLIYIGDPMCSWCWGMAPELEQVADFCEHRELEFQIKVGGLRPGGGDLWDEKMKDFLRHHWDQVHAATGQPFSFKLLELPTFNYDTEPACRLVVAARKWLGQGNIQWFKQLQKTFYVDSLDLGDISNIRTICRQFDIDFQEFNDHFQSEEIVQATKDDFIETREWGINGYPSLVIKDQHQLTGISYGYSTFQKIRERLEHYLSANSTV